MIGEFDEVIQAPVSPSLFYSWVRSGLRRKRTEMGIWSVYITLLTSIREVANVERFMDVFRWKAWIHAFIILRTEQINWGFILSRAFYLLVCGENR